MLRLEVASDGSPDSGRDLIVRWSLVRHPASLEIPRRNAGTHLIHPQRPRHQRENPPMMDGREDESGCQTFLAQLLQGVEEGIEPRLVDLDDAVRPVGRALRDQTAGVGRKEVVVIP